MGFQKLTSWLPVHLLRETDTLTARILRGGFYVAGAAAGVAGGACYLAASALMQTVGGHSRGTSQRGEGSACGSMFGDDEPLLQQMVEQQDGSSGVVLWTVPEQDGGGSVGGLQGAEVAV